METLERYELLPGIYANEEQQLAIDEMQAFLRGAVGKYDYFTLIGKAGVGKTTVLRKALEAAKGSVIVGALTHKAKEVVESAISNRFYRFYSLAGMLGLKLNIETGKFEADYEAIKSKQLPPISTANVIVIDECSMINEEALNLIFQYKQPQAKLIFCGDNNQLPPIREEGSKFAGEPSPVFSGGTSVYLYQRMRQGEESTILPYADYYWNNANGDKPVRNPVPVEAKINSEHLEFISPEEILEKSTNQFKDAVSTRNPNIIRVVTYKNDTRMKLNQVLRYAIFENPDVFETGEILMFYDSYTTYCLSSGLEIKLENSQEVFVNTATRVLRNVHEESFPVFVLNISVTVKGRKMNANVEVLDPMEKGNYAALVTRLFDIAAKIPSSRVWDRKKAYAVAWSARNRFAKVDYAYAIGVHKSQGSTYNEVIVHESDIMGIKSNGDKEKSQAMYTAITRAKNKAYIVTG